MATHAQLKARCMKAMKASDRALKAAIKDNAACIKAMKQMKAPTARKSRRTRRG